MSPVVRLVAAAMTGMAGLLLVAGVARPAYRPLREVVDGWHHDPRATKDWRRSVPTPSFTPDVRADLRVVGRAPQEHAVLLLGSSVGGGLGALALLLLAHGAGAWTIGPLSLLSVVGVAGLTPLVVHTSMRSSAAALRTDLRHQLSAYLDVVTMLLAANVGNEGALRQAASLGDGRFFVELRRRMLSAETASRSLVAALAQLGDDLELAELQQVAASASLASSSGAPVAATLAAKCASLRHALSAELEADARVRSGRISIPLVGMSLLIMTAVIYPALQFTP